MGSNVWGEIYYLRFPQENFYVFSLNFYFDRKMATKMKEFLEHIWLKRILKIKKLFTFRQKLFIIAFY